MSRTRKDTKWGHLIEDGHFDNDESDDSEDETQATQSSVDRQHQTVVVDRETNTDSPAPRTIRYRAVISHGDRDWEPVCTHVDRLHQLAHSAQFDPDGHLAWGETPSDVQADVVAVVAGVDTVADLDPEASLGVSFDEKRGENDE